MVYNLKHMKKAFIVFLLTLAILPLQGVATQAVSISTVGVPSSILRNWRILPTRRTSQAVLRYIEMKEAEEEARERAIVAALLSKSKLPTPVATTESNTSEPGSDAE
jgi:hypothetical protein